MSGTPQIASAARRPRVRLFAAVVVLAGLLTLSGSQCAAGMGAGMPPAHATSSTMMVDLDQAGGQSEGRGAAGGVLALCLALLFVVVAAAGLRLTWRRIVAAPGQHPRGVMIRVASLRAPSLAQLCVLRA